MFVKPNEFNPSRWNDELEKSYYAISFSKGPQECPGKKLAIYLTQSFVYNFIKIKNIRINNLKSDYKLNKNNIPQIINPFKINFLIKVLETVVSFTFSGFIS